MDKAEPTCKDPQWTATTQRVEARFDPHLSSMPGLGGWTKYWLVVEVEALCNGVIRVLYRTELQAGVSASDGPKSFPITVEPGGAIRAGGARFDVNKAVAGFEGQYIRALSPAAEVDRWRNYLRATDRIESYRSGSAPHLLASHFSLPTTFDRDEFGPRDRWAYSPGAAKIVRAGSGLNANGIYVFQPKTRQASSQVCQNPEPELLDTKGGTVLVMQSLLGSQYPKPLEAVRMTYGLRCGAMSYPSITRNLYLPFEDYLSVDFDEGFHIILQEKGALTDGDIKVFLPSDETVTAGALASPFTVRIGFKGKSRVYQYASAVSGLAYPLESMYLPDEMVAPTWTGLGMDGGQADQLLIKMQDVLDEFYGYGQWEGNPQAQIDLVAHSQGALAVRAMIANNQQPSARNPISHIRQIMAIASPLHGTALATDNTVLRSPAADLDADLGQKPFPELASLRDGLKETVVTLPIVGEVKIPGIDCPSSFRLPGMQPNVREGCLDLHAHLDANVKTGVTTENTLSLSLAGPWLGPYTLRASGSVRGISMAVEQDDLENPLREGLAKMAKEGSYLAWPQSSQFIENLVRNPNNWDVPKYPGTTYDYIPFTTLASGSVGPFVQEAVGGISEALRGACPVGDKFWQKEGDYKGVTTARAWVTCTSFRKAVRQITSQLSEQLSPIDKGWSEQGDMFVDLASQKAVRTRVQSWNPSNNPAFKARSFAYNPLILHGPFKVDQTIEIPGTRLNPAPLNAVFEGASMQGCDILDNLGVTGYRSDACARPEHAGFRNLQPSNSLFQLPPKFWWQGSNPTGSVQMPARLVNTTGKPLFGFQIEVPVHADVQAMPVARLVGALDASVQMIQVAKGAWMARIRSGATVAPTAFWPSESGFQLELSEPQGLPVRIAMEEQSDDWSGSVEAVVRTAQGTILSGIDPIPALRLYSEQVATSIEVDVAVSGYQSRGSDVVWTKPVLALRNESARRLEDFDVYYRVHTREDGAKPEISLWNVPYGVASGAAEVVADGDTGWFAVIHLRGAKFLPDQELQDLKFGLHWPDWAAWDARRDPSDPGSSETVDLSLFVVDLDAMETVATLPEVPVQTTTWKVEGFDEGLSDLRLIKPRLRLTNMGGVSAKGFTLRVPFLVPAGIEPRFENWYAPGCVASIEGTALARAVVYSCPQAQVPAGGVWPDVSGLVFGLHDAAWQIWPRGGDALTQALGASWSVVPAVEVLP